MPLLRPCCKRKIVVLLLLITTVSVIWTCWIGSRLQSHREIPVEVFQLAENSRTPGNLEKLNSLRINGIFGQDKELSYTKSVLENYPTDSITRKSKVSDGITDKALLQRLQEVNIYLIHITLFTA